MQWAHSAKLPSTQVNSTGMKLFMFVCYIAGTHYYCLVSDYKKAGEMTSFILGYSDSDWSGHWWS